MRKDFWLSPRYLGDRLSFRMVVGVTGAGLAFFRPPGLLISKNRTHAVCFGTPSTGMSRVVEKKWRVGL